MLINWLSGLLVDGWLVDWLVGRLVGWIKERIDVWMMDRWQKERNNEEIIFLTYLPKFRRCTSFYIIQSSI